MINCGMKTLKIDVTTSGLWLPTKKLKQKGLEPALNQILGLRTPTLS